jgi:hypothetical protein
VITGWKIILSEHVVEKRVSKPNKLKALFSIYGGRFTFTGIIGGSFVL